MVRQTVMAAFQNGHGGGERRGESGAQLPGPSPGAGTGTEGQGVVGDGDANFVQRRADAGQLAGIAQAEDSGLAVELEVKERHPPQVPRVIVLVVGEDDAVILGRGGEGRAALDVPGAQFLFGRREQDVVKSETGAGGQPLKVFG